MEFNTLRMTNYERTRVRHSVKALSFRVSRDCWCNGLQERREQEEFRRNSPYSDRWVFLRMQVTSNYSFYILTTQAQIPQARHFHQVETYPSGSKGHHWTTSAPTRRRTNNGAKRAYRERAGKLPLVLTTNSFNQCLFLIRSIETSPAAPMQRIAGREFHYSQ